MKRLISQWWEKNQQTITNEMTNLFNVFSNGLDNKVVSDTALLNIVKEVWKVVINDRYGDFNSLYDNDETTTQKFKSIYINSLPNIESAVRQASFTSSVWLRDVENWGRVSNNTTESTEGYSGHDAEGTFVRNGVSAREKSASALYSLTHMNTYIKGAVDSIAIEFENILQLIY